MPPFQIPAQMPANPAGANQPGFLFGMNPGGPFAAPNKYPAGGQETTQQHVQLKLNRIQQSEPIRVLNTPGTTLKIYADGTVVNLFNNGGGVHIRLPNGQTIVQYNNAPGNPRIYTPQVPPGQRMGNMVPGMPAQPGQQPGLQPGQMPGQMPGIRPAPFPGLAPPPAQQRMLPDVV